MADKEKFYDCSKCPVKKACRGIKEELKKDYGCLLIRAMVEAIALEDLAKSLKAMVYEKVEG